jgi:hypothetical protein
MDLQDAAKPQERVRAYAVDITSVLGRADRSSDPVAVTGACAAIGQPKAAADAASTITQLSLTSTGNGTTGCTHLRAHRRR